MPLATGLVALVGALFCGWMAFAFFGDWASVDEAIESGEASDEQAGEAMSAMLHAIVAMAFCVGLLGVAATQL
jgi:hypothetical protein